MREINRGELHRARLGSQRTGHWTGWLIDSLSSAETSLHKEAPSSTGQSLRWETDNALQVDRSMQKEEEKLKKSWLCERKLNLYCCQDALQELIDSAWWKWPWKCRRLAWYSVSVRTVTHQLHVKNKPRQRSPHCVAWWTLHKREETEAKPTEY